MPAKTLEHLIGSVNAIFNIRSAVLTFASVFPSERARRQANGLPLITAAHSIVYCQQLTFPFSIFIRIFTALADQHSRLITDEAQCDVPKQRVMSVPHSSSTRYIPPRTILHQCTDDTGCCDVGHKCVAERVQMVSRHFFVSQAPAAPPTARPHCLAPVSGDLHRRRAVHRGADVPEPHQVPLHQEGPDLPADGGVQVPRVVREHSRPGRPVLLRLSHGCRERRMQAEKDRGRALLAARPTVSELRARTKLNIYLSRSLFVCGVLSCISSGKCTVPTCLHGAYNASGGGCPTADRALDGIRLS